MIPCPAYLESVRGLWLAGLIVSFGSIAAGLFATDFYLGEAHNNVEQEKVIKFRTKEEIEAELKARESS
jgi:hypothetical protein